MCPVCVCVCALQFHNLQELRHSASLANKVFIQRDYSEGTTCRFHTKFPPELDTRVRRGGREGGKRVKRRTEGKDIPLIAVCVCFPVCVCVCVSDRAAVV